MNGLLITLSVIGGIVVLLLLLLFLGSVRVRLSINGDVTVQVSVLGIRKKLLPRPKPQEKLRDVAGCRHPERLLRKEEKRRQKAAEKAEQKRLREEQKRAAKEAAKKSAPTAPVPNLKENLDMILSLLKRAYALTKGRIRITFRRFHLRVATGDASQTAILYGVIVQTAAYLLQWTEDHFNHVRRRDGDMTVEADFVSPKSTADLDLRISVRLFRAVRIGVGMLRAFRAERRRARRRAAKRVSGTNS